MTKPAPQSETCLCMTLRRATRAATRLYDAQMKKTGLKITQFSLLRNIRRAGEITVTELARLLDLERTAMGRNLDLLEREGLIQTIGSDDDQRVRVVRLTPKGRRTEAAALPVWRQAQTEMKQRLRKGAFRSLNDLFATDLAPKA